jgi:predicted dehydrogenase
MLRIGILGAANIAPQAIIYPAFRADAVEVVAVGASRTGAATAYAARYGIPTAYGSYGALIDDPNVDLVYNALAVRDHVALSIAALEAGKHVLCEKPIAMNAAEASRLVDTARRTDRRAIEAFHYRYHPLFLALQRLRAENALGTIRSLASEISDVREFDPASIIHDPAVGGGTLLHAGCYAVNWMRALAVEEPTVLSASVERNPLGADAAIDTVLAFPSGIRGTLEATMAPGRSMKPGNRLTIEGDLGTATIENLIAPQFGHSVRIRMNGEPERAFTIAGNPSYDYQLAAVVSAIESGETLPTEGDELILGMAAIDAIYRTAGLTV